MYQNIFITNRTENEPSTVYIFDDKVGVIIHPYKDFDYAYRRDPNGNYKSIYGQNLKKIRIWNKEMLDIYESDVPRETRVLTDLYLDSDEPSVGHNVGVFDIETSILLVDFQVSNMQIKKFYPLHSIIVIRVNM